MEFGVLFDLAASVIAAIVLFSLAASAINEAIADALNLRGRMLRRAIAKLLEKEPITPTETQDKTAEFFAYPDISKLRTPWGNLPSAVEPRRYALTVLKLLDDRKQIEAQAVQQLGEVRQAALDTIRDAAVAAGTGAGAAAMIERTIADVSARTAVFRTAVDERLATLEREFNEMMDRASGWYLRKTKIMLFCIGLVLAVGSNIDILQYARTMAAQENLVAQNAAILEMLEGQPAAGVGEASAGAASGQNAAPLPDQRIAAAVADMRASAEAAHLTLGWTCRELDTGRWAVPGGGYFCPEGSGFAMPYPSQILGWIIVAFGVTLGAQFWFDLFKRLVHLRTSGIAGGAAVTDAKRRA